MSGVVINGLQVYFLELTSVMKLNITFFIVIRKVTNEQQSTTFAFPCTMIGSTCALERCGNQKDEEGIQYWGGHGLP